MNILFVINSLLDKAGSERVACQLANLFHSKLGHHITLVNRFATKDECAFSISEQIDYQFLKGNYYIFYKKLQSLIDRNQYDFIIIHNMGKLSLLCSQLRTKGAKLISLEHVSFSSRPKWVKYSSKVLYRKYDTIITLTDRDKNEYINWHKNVIKINNITPFSPQNITNSLRENKIIAVGRLTYQKNFISLIKSWEKIHEYIPEWHLEIYGKGEDEKLLTEYIAQNSIKNVFLKGVSSNIQEIYQKASFLVMSSRYEGLPMVLIEAQTFGLPIISFDCPFGPREIVEHQKTGLLVEDQNITMLSEAILTLSNNRAQLEEYSKNALILSKQYTVEKILSEWQNRVLSQNTYS
ncbi:MAG: glycosyltransferase family 4 protein [Clostridium celatum]|nr:glycosyltransferase family 4 protein [Clostridium celatum]